MSEPKIYALADLAQEAQAKIQADFADINPIVGVITSLRTPHFPADALTIDCLISKKRILVILHDAKPDEVTYQFGYSDRDVEMELNRMALSDVTRDQIYEWIRRYFSSAVSH